MEPCYAHLNLEDRCAIARLRQEGYSIRQIAAALDRSPSSICRELKRNAGARVGYMPAYADQQAKARRWTGSKLERDDDLRQIVLDCLARGWSPEQVAGSLGRAKPPRLLSYETIYRFIYAQIRPGHPRRPRAKVPPPSPRQATLQAGTAYRKPPAQLVQAARQPPPQNPHPR